MTEWLIRRGFDASRFYFAGRTALAACLAFVLAWLLGLEHPQWAAMTVWAASQPTRGQLLEKSLFRILGTLSGTFVGVLLVMGLQIHPAILVGGLALWVALCTGIGNLQRGFVSYGTILAGYTAAMVSLLDAAHPEQVLELGGDRLATVLTGVLIATLVGLVFAPSATHGAMRKRLGGLIADLLEAAAGDTGPAEGRALLSELAKVDEGLDPQAAGSIRSRRGVRSARAVMIAAIPVLLGRLSEPRDPGTASAEALHRAAEALRADRPAEALPWLDRATEQAIPGAGLRHTLPVLRQSLALWSQPDDPAPAPRDTLPVVLHRDWVGAREAMVRAGGALLIFGAIWILTGWSVGAFMLLGLSVMLSLFSTFESPAKMMRWVFLGQICGVLGALACRWLVWPLAGSEVEMILLTLPFILVGPFLVGHRRTVAVSFDYNMVLMLLLQPHWPLTGTFGGSVAGGLAVVAAPVAAMAAYRLVYPTSLKRKIDAVLDAMLRDLRDLAGDARALAHRPVWQARLYHRTLRLLRLSEHSSRAHEQALDASLALLHLGHAAMRCHEIVISAERSASDRRAARAALSRLQQLPARPERAEAALTRFARRLASGDAELLRRGAAGAAVLERIGKRPLAE